VPSLNAQTSLSNATTGTGTTVDLDVARSNITMVATVTGTVLLGSVALEVSQDGEEFVQAGSTLSLASNTNGQVSIGGGAWRYARARIVVNVTGGATVTATIMEAG
jgi:hypothetical protein